MAGLILSFVKLFAQLRIHIVHESYLGSVPQVWNFFRVWCFSTVIELATGLLSQICIKNYFFEVIQRKVITEAELYIFFLF